jgi:TonB family protein
MNHGLRRPLLLALTAAGLLLPSTGRAQKPIREAPARASAPKLTRPPRLLQFVQATYPPSAAKRALQGTVKLLIDLDAAGKVTRIEQLSAPDPALFRAAEQAIKKFRFAPAEVDGKPAAIRLQYSYHFVLEKVFRPRLPGWITPGRPAAPTRNLLAGTVRERGTRLPVPGVAVSIPRLGLEVTTDARGRFAFSTVPPQRYTVQVTSAAHARETVQVELKPAEQQQVTFYLRRLQQDPYETVVRGERRSTVVTRVTLKQRELTTVPGTFGDPIRVVENLPGVARVPFVGGALIIRGAPPGDSGVFLDGVEIPNIYHFMGGPSVLHPEFLERIDYFPGNADARYGRISAGVVDVTTRSATTGQLRGAVDLNLLNAAGFVNVPVSDKLSLAGAFRRSYADAVLPGLLEATGQSATAVVPIYYDYQARVDLDLGGNDALFVLALGSDDQLDVVTSNPTSSKRVSVESRINSHRILAGWRWQISDRLRSRLTTTAGYDFTSLDFGDTGSNTWTAGAQLREDLELRLSKRVRLRAGLDLKLQNVWYNVWLPVRAEWRDPGSGLGPFTGEVKIVTGEQLELGLGAYLDASFAVTDRLELLPGFRAELYRYAEDLRPSVEPRLTARYKLWSWTTLKAAAGLFAKEPPPNTASAAYGNPNLQLQHALHLTCGVEQKLSAALGLELSVYFIHRYDQVIRTRAMRRVGPVLEPLLYTNAGRGQSYGMELLLKHKVTRRLYGWLAYTLAHSEEQLEPDEEPVATFFDQTHILTLVASVRLGRGWEAGTRFRLVSGRPETPVFGGFFDVDRDRYIRIIGELRSQRRPLFHQLDLRLEKTWTFQRWRLVAYLDLQNVYNAENPEATIYDFRYEQSAQLPGLPFLPSLGLRGSF